MSEEVSVVLLNQCMMLLWRLQFHEDSQGMSGQSFGLDRQLRHSRRKGSCLDLAHQHL